MAASVFITVQFHNSMYGVSALATIGMVVEVRRQRFHCLGHTRQTWARDVIKTDRFIYRQ